MAKAFHYGKNVEEFNKGEKLLLIADGLLYTAEKLKETHSEKLKGDSIERLTTAFKKRYDNVRLVFGKSELTNEEIDNSIYSFEQFKKDMEMNTIREEAETYLSFASN